MISPDSHRARKRFGQNFLHDKNIIAQIVSVFEADSALSIVEIGPGKGALTMPLLRASGHLHVIEIDTDLAALLEEKCASLGHLELHIGDALKFDYSKIEPGPLQIIGNLPYNISTPLLFHLLDYLSNIKFMVLMLQKEVVDRICASEDEREYGRLSVMIQSRCDVENLFSVPPGAFTPAPKVTSAVVKISPKKSISPDIKNFVLFEKIVRQAFSQRRKTLRNALRDLVQVSCLETLSISATARPGNLSVNDYINIANHLYHHENQ
jgi:16S rRNA (adenine1518-N6/adenine1519-N6)-dimethyltransferase